MKLPEVQQFEDPDNQSDVPAAQPMRMALRNSAAALVGLGLVGLGSWLKYYHGHTPSFVFGATLAGLAIFAVGTCFAHAFLARNLGPRRAGVIMKIMAGLVLVGMVLGMWWSLREK